MTEKTMEKYMSDEEDSTFVSSQTKNPCGKVNAKMFN